MRTLAGLRTIGWQYGQRGVVATVATRTPNRTAWQRFLPNGPLALLPVRDGYSNIVWSTSPQAARELEMADSASFAGAIGLGCVHGGGSQFGCCVGPKVMESPPSQPTCACTRLFVCLQTA